MRVLVTGAAGFIGSHLLDSLVADGHTVTVIDNFDPFYCRELKEGNVARYRAHPLVQFVEGDICDPEVFSACVGPYDAIVHLAAKAGVRPSILDPSAYNRTNVTGTQAVLEFARRTGVRQFVFASSSSVYGVNPKTPWREDEHDLQPISPYAATKVSGELLGHVYSHLFGIRFLALRFFTVYGPRQRPDLAIRKFAELMLSGKPVPFFGDGSTSRDYTHISDIVSGIRAGIEYCDTGFEIINLGNTRTVSLSEMVSTIESALGLRALRSQQPLQPGDVPVTCADISKAQRLLGYSPRTQFSQGVQEFVAWLTARRFTATA